MDWISGLQNAIDYIEDNLLNDVDYSEVAKCAYSSSFHFQRVFSILTNMTVGEYVRNRRLSLAGVELSMSNNKVIDVALKYCYDTPESFTKAFTRFHGITPSAAREAGAKLKSFNPLSIKLTLEGGTIMDYKIVEKEAFTVIGASKIIKYDVAKTECPKFWEEHFKSGKGKTICGMYGINIDESMGMNEFEYMIADNYLPCNDIPKGFIARTIPKLTWAVFPCRGPMPDALQNINNLIYSEWMTNNKDYVMSDGYCVEMYSNPSDFNNGIQDKNYYCEIWIPVKKK